MLPKLNPLYSLLVSDEERGEKEGGPPHLPNWQTLSDFGVVLLSPLDSIPLSSPILSCLLATQDVS